MKYEFKKGDKVRQINVDNYDVKIGDIGIVQGDISTNDEYKTIYINFGKSANTHYVRNIELVSKSKPFKISPVLRKFTPEVLRKTADAIEEEEEEKKHLADLIIQRDSLNKEIAKIRGRLR